ncbi:hypothetical protein MYX82_00545 [Acidobacteria bacterium AH-259-D05]|nr:hypothetical protein [Acidobacteria bacterium AH-259-D05]
MNLRSLQSGVYAGLAGGAVFGAMMALMGMLPMIGQMVGHPSPVTGFLVHVVISVVIGASFVVFFHPVLHSTSGGLGYGLLYGGVWWFLGPLTIMPLLMGMGLGVNWNASAAFAMLPSLVGHLIYGAILGLSYTWLKGSQGSPTPTSGQQVRTLAELCMYNTLSKDISLKREEH